MYPDHDPDPIFPHLVTAAKAGRARVVYTIDPLVPADPLMPDDYIANISIAMKKNGSLVIKEKGTVLKSGGGNITIDEELDLSAGDRLYFVCASDRYDFTKYVQLGIPRIYYKADEIKQADGTIIRPSVEVNS